MATKKKLSNIRFRRLDTRNFTYERRKGEGDKSSWVSCGYFSTLKAAVRNALNDGFSGEDTQMLMESIKRAEAAVLQAIEELGWNPQLLTTTEGVVVELPEAVVDEIPTEKETTKPTPKSKVNSKKAMPAPEWVVKELKKKHG